MIIPGMEVQTNEEVHLLTLFEKMRDYVKWCEFLQPHRSKLLNDEKRFGAQFVVDEEDELVRTEDCMLLASTDLGVQAVTMQVAAMGGITIAAHVDRPAFGLFSQLGFIPSDAILAAVEVSRRTSLTEAREKYSKIGRLPIVTSSDAHTIEDFISGPKTMFLMETPTLSEIRQALDGENGRRLHQ